MLAISHFCLVSLENKCTYQDIGETTILQWFGTVGITLGVTLATRHLLVSATIVTVTGRETSEANSNLWDWKIKIIQKWQFGEWSLKAAFKRQTISHKLPCLKINFRVCSSYKKGLGFYSNVFILLFFLKTKQCRGYFFLTPLDFIRAKCYDCGSSGMCTQPEFFFFLNLRGNKEWPQIKPIPTLDNMTVESVDLLCLLFCQCWCDRCATVVSLLLLG